MATKRIFDGDNQKVIGTFDSKDEKAIIEKYEAKGYSASADRDGDIVIYEEDED